MVPCPTRPRRLIAWAFSRSWTPSVDPELGVEKPDRRIFDEAIRRCTEGSPLDQEACWMVGDAPAPDIGGGRAAGLRTIWLHRGRSWNPLDGDPPDVTVGSPVEAVQEILS